MTDANYWQRTIPGRGVNRRAFLRSTALAGAGAAAFLAGCSSTAKPAANATAAGGSTAATNIFAVPEGKRGGTITISGSDPTTGWDPHATISSLTGGVAEPMGIKLIRHDYRKTPPWQSGADELLLGELAEKWESPDPLTYNFTIRKGINWPNQDPMNGRPITAQDVKYAFDHGKLPTSPTQPAVWDNFASFTAIDDYTVQFKIKSPNWQFLNMLDSYCTEVMPKGIYDWTGPDGMKSAEKARGGGPWILDEYRPQSVIRWKPNEAYRKIFGVPYADRLDVAILDPGAPLLQAFIGKKTHTFLPRTGQLDLARQGRPDAKVAGETYRAANDTALYMKMTDKPFDDIRVRRAVSMSVDREGWGKTLQVPFKIETGPISWGFPGWKLDPAKMDPAAAQYLKYNPAEAKKLVEAAGVSSNTTYQIHEFPYDTSYEANCQFLIDAMGKVGIKAAIKVYERNNWLASAYTDSKTFTGMMYTVDALDRIPAQLADRLTKNNGRNHSNIQDDTLEKLLNGYLLAKGEAEAKPIVNNIQTRTVDQAFAVYRPQPSAPTMWDPALQNFEGQTPVGYQTQYQPTFLWLNT